MKIQKIIDKHKLKIKNDREKLSNKLFKCGVNSLVFCVCGNVLNYDKNVAIETISDGLYKYTCDCGEISYFNFVIAPVPLKMVKVEKGFVVKK